jgi:RND superfamily putative drug exporter
MVFLDPSATPALTRWTRFVLRRRRAVLVCWVAVVIAGAYAFSTLPGRLVQSFAVPGTESQRAQSILAEAFGERPEGTFTVVFRVRDSGDKAVRRAAARRLGRVSRVLPAAQVGAVRAGGGIVYAELTTTLPAQRAKAYVERLRRALAQTAGPPALVTGQAAIQHDLEPLLASDLRRADAFALPLVLLVLAAVLGVSLAVAVPFVVAACTVGGALASLWLAAGVTTVSPYATNLVALIGLALAIDYSLLIVTRYREELEHADDRELALVRAVSTAGRAVAFSGAAVAVSLSLLLLVPVPFIQTLGVAGLLVPLVSIAAALTLQPALLSFFGRGSLRGAPLPRRRRQLRFWECLTRVVMRRPVAVLVPTTLMLLVLAAPALGLRVTPGSFASLPGSTESVRGLAALRGGFGSGALTPTQIVVDTGSRGGARSPAVQASIKRLADGLFHDPEVYVVANGREAPYVDASARYARVGVVGRHEYGEKPSRALVRRVRARQLAAADFPSGVQVHVGGVPPQGSDFLERAYGLFPWLVGGALLVTSLVLARAFRSLLLPVKAVLLNVLAVAAGYGVVVAVFGHGIGAGLLGVQRADEIEGWIPIFMFATVFGLSMDYEVFMVSRMREAWDRGRSNVDAVAHGLERTGRLITAAALVMVISFSGFVAGGVPGLQQFGLGLVAAIAIDATLIRLLLVPSLMAVLGRWNWWLPSRLGLRSDAAAGYATSPIVD